MYGNRPDQWHERLQDVERWRLITNALTRMRMVTADHKLDMSFKGHPDKAPANLYPWFSAPQRQPITTRLIFGHWAALGGMRSETLIGLDTGCVWGNQLTAYCLETHQWQSLACRKFSDDD
jgi:bis(5'-nucleosyl)-tetraphosphatase (symmetrical)